MDEFDMPPVCELHRALTAGDKAAALQLLASGVDVSTKDPRPLLGDNQTALHYAVGFDDASLIDTIINSGADVNAQTTNGQTALWLACNGGHRNSVHALLKHGANPNIRSSEGHSPLGRVLASDSSVIEMLRSFGASD
ncbi:MAG: ankyrin repeat domain-containing protein [Planctomycetota bacterium]